MASGIVFEQEVMLLIRQKTRLALTAAAPAGGIIGSSAIGAAAGVPRTRPGTSSITSGKIQTAFLDRITPGDKTRLISARPMHRPSLSRGALSSAESGGYRMVRFTDFLRYL